MGRDLFHERRNRLFFWIGGGGKEAFFKLFILLANFVLFVFEEFLKFVSVFVDGIGKICEVIRQELSICESHHRGANGLRQSASVAEVRIGKMGVPIEIIVDGMIDAPAAFAV